MSRTRYYKQSENADCKVYKKYEYDCKVIRPAILVDHTGYIDFVKAEFNKLGQEGWEVIQFVTVTQDGLATIVWVKRLVGLIGAFKADVEVSE